MAEKIRCSSEGRDSARAIAGRAPKPNRIVRRLGKFPGQSLRAPQNAIVAKCGRLNIYACL